MHYTHRPVLLEEVLTGLNIQPDGVYVDGTFGRSGIPVHCQQPPGRPEGAKNES